MRARDIVLFYVGKLKFFQKPGPRVKFDLYPLCFPPFVSPQRMSHHMVTICKNWESNRRSGTAIFSVNAARKRLKIDRTYNKSLLQKNSKIDLKKHLYGALFGRNLVGGEIRVWKSTKTYNTWNFSHVQPINIHIWGTQSEIVPSKGHRKTYYRHFRPRQKNSSLVFEKDESEHRDVSILIEFFWYFLSTRTPIPI